MKPPEKKKNEWLPRNPWGPRWSARGWRFFFETHCGLILASLKLTLHLKMDGWNTSCLLGRPIFRGEMLVSGSVFRWVFDQVSSEHEKILCLKKLEGARFLLLDMLETHRLISPWMRLGPHSRNWPTAPRTIVGAGPGPKTLVSQRTWHQQSPLSNPWHENSRIKRILSNGELVVKILPECSREFWSVKHQPYQRWTDLLQTKGRKKV